MIQIITGSTLGGSEYVGDHISDLLIENGFTTLIHNQPNIDEIEACGTWLIITSTHGAGDYPDNIRPFFDQLKTAPPRVNGLKFAVIAIGDSNYDTFCHAGKDAKATLLDIGCTEICPSIEIDVVENSVPEDVAQAWLEANISAFK